jgi:beta-lactam-binding protein with PASTA domain
MRLKTARRAIRRRNCSVGRIRRVRSRRAGQVLRQSPSAGAIRPRGFSVRLVVGRR